jgi:hypothetical protein
MEAADSINILSVNELDETLDASPVAIGNELYLRGRSNLYCIAETGDRSPQN